MSKAVLITGASGYVGSYIYKALEKEKYELIGTYYKNKLFDELIQVDLTNKKQVETLISENKPSLIIHIAADAHSKTCENDPENAQNLNVKATRYIVDSAKEKGIKVLYLSTFACYNPSNVYGNTKFKAERIIEELEDYLILRASLIIGVSPNRQNANYFNKLLDDIEARKDIEADSSWEFEVTCLNHLASIFKTIINNNKINNQIVPVVAKGVTSRLKIAKYLTKDIEGIEVIEIDQNRVIPLPELDLSAYDKYSLRRPDIERCLASVKSDINNLLTIPL
jgi:dTDP-4-dehydrorhamnose reductase